MIIHVHENPGSEQQTAVEDKRVDVSLDRIAARRVDCFSITAIIIIPPPNPTLHSPSPTPAQPPSHPATHPPVFINVSLLRFLCVVCVSEYTTAPVTRKISCIPGKASLGSSFFVSSSSYSSFFSSSPSSSSSS
ncbi:hypothetical protein E2C01_041435 [Portunus trituberculatus]|uniref:Uncharacterized protein n=1 Tax=Portunus trituberculatus TaxID=210409 RepID=A0A5B7FK16_PORTR|nr:hypothetical protein [Portunus trituberculatus]